MILILFIGKCNKYLNVTTKVVSIRVIDKIINTKIMIIIDKNIANDLVMVLI